MESKSEEDLQTSEHRSIVRVGDTVRRLARWWTPAVQSLLVCHNDFGPWNLVYDGDAPVGILDWDFAIAGLATDVGAETSGAGGWSVLTSTSTRATMWVRVL